jgi:hypothetical protein
MDAEKKLIPYNWPLNGRLITSIDGTLLPDAHFQALENMRYTDGGIAPVSGMTKINASALAKLKVQNGFHFKKSQPVTENHVFVQVTNPADSTSAIYKSDNTTDIPAQDTFTLFKAMDSDNTVYFSEAPDQSMVFCDGYHNYVYSGAEYRCARFINFNPDESFSYDFTTQANNNLTDTKNVFTLTGLASSGIDSNTMLLLHGDGNLTDSSPTTAHTCSSFGWSNGSFEDNDFAALTGWTDSDSGTGASTQATYDSRSALKATSGASAGAGHYSLLTKDVGTLGATYAITIVLNLDAVGTLANDDQFEMSVDNGDITLAVRWCSDGLYIYDGATWNEVGTNICVADVWQEYTFVVDSTTPASANVVVYLDDTLIDATVDCSNVTTTTDGLVQLRQYGTTTVAQITYVDKIKVGTAINSVSYSTTTVFGTYSISLDGSEAGARACITIPDNADFDFSAGKFAIDCRFMALNLTAIQPIYYQETDFENFFYVYVSTAGAVTFVVVSGGATVVTAATPDATIVADTYYHIEIDENGDDWYIFVDGVQKGYVSDAQRCADYTGIVRIGKSGAFHVAQSSCLIDEFRVSNNYRHIANFTLPLTAYGTTASTHVYIGSTRPISGAKFYIKTANTAAAGVAAYYWNGSAWTSCGTITDGTAVVAGTPLAQTGVISFTSTASTAKIRVIDENIGYYYYFVFSGIDDATTISQVTLQAPVQDLKDIWDGSPRQVYSCLVYTSAYADYTTNVYNLEYDSADTTTYVNVGTLTSAQHIYGGFNERLTGVKVYLGETNVNTNACVAYVDYWNGTAWTSVGAIVDGTSVSGVSFARTGNISWNSPESVSEFVTSIGNSSKWYFYRIRFSATLSATVHLDHLSGIPVQVELMPYRYPVLWQNRLWMLNDQSNNKNTAIGSSYGTVCVFNGIDSGMLIFGGSKEVNCGKTIFTRYGGSLYENMIVCKNNETYLVDGTSFTGDDSGSGSFVVYQVSGTRGCIAPLTMQPCDTGYEVAPGITKHIITWLSNSGVVMFDSNSMIEISGDISDKFRMNNTDGLNRSLSNKSSAFYDSSNGEYHLLIPIGATSTYLNEEYVYDVVRKKWFQVKRGAKYLWCGFEVEDQYGNYHVYGGTGDGFIERLEYGTTFDGLGITYKFRLSDSLMNTSWDTRKEIRQIRLVGECKTTTDQTIAINHYADGSTTASTPAIIAMASSKTGRRFYKFARSVALRGTTHSLEFSITTNNETGGFAPLFISGHYKVIDYDMEAE